MLGTKLTTNDFLPQRCISSGPNSEVLLCTYIPKDESAPNCPKTVVVKEIDALACMEDLMQNEVEACRKLHHKNIVKLLDYFTENNFVYLVFEHLKGKEIE